jgi:hypothetical protein
VGSWIISVSKEGKGIKDRVEGHTLVCQDGSYLRRSNVIQAVWLLLHKIGKINATTHGNKKAEHAVFSFPLHGRFA